MGDDSGTDDGRRSGRNDWGTPSDSARSSTTGRRQLLKGLATAGLLSGGASIAGASPDGGGTVTSLTVEDPTGPTDFGAAPTDVETMFTWSENHVYGPYRSVVTVGPNDDPVWQETFVYRPGEEIRDETEGSETYTMTETVSLPADVPQGTYDLTVLVQENFPVGSDNWGFGKVETIPDAVRLGNEGSRFRTLRDAKLAMADQIEDVSQSIDERARVEKTLGQLEAGAERGDFTYAEASDAVGRMIRGEDLTELTLGTISPVTVSAGEEQPSRVGEPSDSPAADDSFDIAGETLSMAVAAGTTLLVVLGSFQSLAAWVTKAASRVGDALDFINGAITALTDALPFVSDLLTDAVKTLAGETEDEIEDGEDDGENLIESILSTFTERFRDPLTNGALSRFEGGFEAALEDFDDRLRPSNGDLDLEGSQKEAEAAADSARAATENYARRVDASLDLLNLLGSLADLLTLCGAVLLATGIGAPVGGAIALASAVFGFSLSAFGVYTGVNGLYRLRDMHEDGLQRIAAGGV